MVDSPPDLVNGSQLPPGTQIRISNPDAPIYRIYPLWFFEQALRLRQLIMVPPALWEDPFEVVGNAIAVNRRDGEQWRQEIINQDLPPIFAQCWSATEESDTLLRAYSRVSKDPTFGRNTTPRDEGVRVRSTPRKLLQALVDGSGKLPKGSCYIGSVRYLSADALLQTLADAIGAQGTKVFQHPDNRAKLILLKRDAFSHEAEVRLIYVRHDRDPKQEKLALQIDPSLVFDEVTFDPRLAPFERMEREQMAKKLGYTGKIGQSLLYQRTVLVVTLDGPTPQG